MAAVSHDARNPNLTSASTLPTAARFLAAPGEMAALIREHAWAATSLGPPEHWSQSLKAMVRMALTTRHPIFIFWGPEHICLYNDAYRASLGPEKHPAILGARGCDAWPEIWDVVGPQIDMVMRGEGSTWHENQLIPIVRHGALQEVFWTYSYGPIDDDGAASGVGGVLAITTETTLQVQTERRLATERESFSQLFEQAPTFMALLRGPTHVFELANPGYLRLVGALQRSLLGMSFAEALPEAVEQGYLKKLDEVYETGRAFVARGSHYVVRGADGTTTQHIVDFVLQPITGANGLTTGVFLEGVDVTQRHDAELALRRSEQRLRLATQAAGMGVYRYEPAEDMVVWENDHPFEIFGLGRDARPVNAARFLAEFVHPDDAGAFETALSRTLTDAAAFNYQGRIRRHNDGAERWIEFTGVLQAAEPRSTPTLLGTAVDITDRKLAEQREGRIADEARAAAVANAKFRTFFEQGSYFGGVLTLDGVVREINELALSATGFARADIIGRQFWDCGWWSPSTAVVESIRLGTARAAAGETFRQESDYFLADGSERRVDRVITPIRDDRGKIVFLAPTGVDVTDRRRAEDETRRLAEALSRSDRLKDEFLAMLAHELRNPLAPLRNGLEILRLKGDDASTVERLRTMMERQLGQLVHLVNDLMDVTRISNGKIVLKRQRTDLKDVIATAIETTQPLLDAKRHRLDCDLDDAALPADVDAVRIAQVVGNLLSNAAKYTPPGGRIALSARRVEAETVIRVSDNGIGIPADSLESIFEMFAQIPASTDGMQSGLGIGLGLVRRLVELHGGTVCASSTLGTGSTLTVRLPLVDIAADAAQQTT